MTKKEIPPIIEAIPLVFEAGLMDIRANPPDVVRGFMPPKALMKYRELYDDITSSGLILEYQDRHSLGELAMMIVESDKLRQSLASDGESLEVQGDRNMVTKKNPARDALDKLRPHIHRYYAAFGMMPSARRSKVNQPPHQGKTEDDGFGAI